MTDYVFMILEIIGTIAFAVSGSLAAIGASLDLFGVLFIGGITAVGGGVCRDVLIGSVPPRIFFNCNMLILAVLTSAVVFVIAYIKRRRFTYLREKAENINNFFDAVGLGAFSVMGAEIAYISGFSDRLLIVLLCGMVTGVGGGLMRDILIMETPYILKKHIYALASIFGGLIYFIIRHHFGYGDIASVISVAVVIIVRMLATKYRWSLPKIKFNGDEND